MNRNRELRTEETLQEVQSIKFSHQLVFAACAVLEVITLQFRPYVKIQKQMTCQLHQCYNRPTGCQSGERSYRLTVTENKKRYLIFLFCDLGENGTQEY